VFSLDERNSGWSARAWREAGRSGMAHGSVSATIPAPSAAVFDLLHDYGRRLEWDALLRAAYLADGHTVTGKGATSVCVGRRSLGGLCPTT